MLKSLLEPETLPLPAVNEVEPLRGPRGVRRPRRAIEPPKPLEDGSEASDGMRRLRQAEDGTWVIVKS